MSDVVKIDPDEIRILTHKDVFMRQHQQFNFFDPQDNHENRMTIYTGDLMINHGAGDNITFMGVVFPLIGKFPPSRGIPPNPAIEPSVGIFPLNDPVVTGGLQFRSAVVSVAPNHFATKDDDLNIQAFNWRADVRRVVLTDSGDRIFAVVLSGTIGSRESHVGGVSYRVTVLERSNRNPDFQPAILIGPQWDGGYAHVGSILVEGVPQS